MKMVLRCGRMRIRSKRSSASGATRQARFWSALYMQRPSPEEGDYFKTDWLKPYDKAPDPKTLRVYGGSDYATTSDGGDFTVHAVVGIDPEGRMYLLDLWRQQAAQDVWVEAFCDLVIEHKPLGWAEETGQIKSALDRASNSGSASARHFVIVSNFQREATRQSALSLCEAGWRSMGFTVPYMLHGIPRFRSELLSFPPANMTTRSMLSG